jgi:hypothetical protein
MAVALIIIFVVCTVNYAREPNLIPAPIGLQPEAPRRAPPELANDRKVTDQDCTKPIDPSAGNLRCK